MKNTILDILNLQEQANQKSQILESHSKYNDKLLEDQNKIDKYNFYAETFGGVNTRTKESLLRDKIKSNLLSEGIYRIFSGSIRVPLYENREALERHLVSSFVNESSSNKLINEFSDKSYLLSELTRNVLEFTEIICEKAKGTDNDSIDPTDKEDFYNKIDEIEDMSYVQDSIKARVSDAINKFNIDNMQKKRDIENQLIATREKINTDMTEELKEFTLFQSKQKENVIRHKEKTIFEAMVCNVVESCYKNDKLKDIFFNEDGSNDMEKIIDHCKIMYGFLEMINTTGMKELECNYIKEQIDNLKIK